MTGARGAVAEQNLCVWSLFIVCGPRGPMTLLSSSLSGHHVNILDAGPAQPALSS